MGDTVEDAEEIECNSKKNSQSFKTLKTLERVSSSESVQHWIDSLNENDWKESSEEQSVTPEVYIKNFENHQFLLVPGTADDDLMLGADARSLSCEGSEHSFSPRLSPSFTYNGDNNFKFCSSNNDSCLILDDEKALEQVYGDDFENENISSENVGQVGPEYEHPRRGGMKNRHQDSIISLQSVSSLFAVMDTDPEGILTSLGFCDEISSPIRRIPSRFLMNPSQAKGIDVREFCKRFMDLGSMDLVSNADFEQRTGLKSRFSQSSIDLSLVDYNDSLLAKLRRAEYKESVIPSITVSDDSQQGEIINEEKSQERLLGQLRLSTVVEEHEPNSRASSFSRSFSGEKKCMLKRQDRLDIEGDNDNIDSVFDAMDYQDTNLRDECKAELKVPDQSVNLVQMGQIHTEKQHQTTRNLLIIDDNNNFESVKRNVPHIQSVQELLPNNVIDPVQKDVQNDSEVDLDVKSISQIMDIHIMGTDSECEEQRYDKAEEEHIESEYSYTDSIEDVFSKRDFSSSVPTRSQIGIVGQFSEDSLDDNEGRKDLAEDSKPRQDEFLPPSRIVYRTLGRVEDLKSIIHKDTGNITANGYSGDTSCNGSLFQPNLRQSQSDNLTKSCNVENESRKQFSSKIKEYFRKLTSRANRRFFSLDSLNTVSGKEKFHSCEDILFRKNSEKSGFGGKDEMFSNSLSFGDHRLNGIQEFEDLETEKAANLDALLKSNTRTSAKDAELLNENGKCKKHSRPERLEKMSYYLEHVSERNERIEECSRPIETKAFLDSKGALDVVGEVEPRKGRKRMITKGYSIESSGFEEENDGCKSPGDLSCRSPPEQGESESKRHYQLCHDCMQKIKKQSMLEEISVNEKNLAASSTVLSNIDESQHTNLTKDQFDYLVMQMTSLREEMGEQEERLKRYIDDSMENIKTSILTEISILSASYKTGSSDSFQTQSLNVDY